MLEETVFDTWYNGRTVRLGDVTCILHVFNLTNDDLSKKKSLNHTHVASSYHFQLATRYAEIST